MISLAKPTDIIIDADVYDAIYELQLDNDLVTQLTELVAEYGLQRADVVKQIDGERYDVRITATERAHESLIEALNAL